MVDFVQAVKILTTANDIKGAYDQVKGVNDYARKIQGKDPKKLTFNDVKIFTNPAMEKALAAAKKAKAAADAAEKAKFTMPACDSLKAWAVAAKAMAQYGADSRQYKDAMKKYIAILEAYDKVLGTLSADLVKGQVELVSMKTTATVMESYSKTLQKAFEVCIKIAMTDVEKAQFFQLSREAFEYSTIMKALVKKYTSLFSRLGTNQRNVADTKKTNLDWIAASRKGLFDSEATMRKNATASSPRR